MTIQPSFPLRSNQHDYNSGNELVALIGGMTPVTTGQELVDCTKPTWKCVATWVGKKGRHEHAKV